MTQEDAHESLEAFLQDVKDGYVRGQATIEQVAEDVAVELSVADFQDGYVHLRVFVDNEDALDRIPLEEGTYFRQLYAVDDKYATLHEKIADRIESEVETDVGNAHEWEMWRPETREDYPFLPSSLNGGTTIAFDDHIQLRDDVGIVEAMETNRLPENKPAKYKKD